MSAVKLYVKTSCKTCGKALHYLDKKGIHYEAVDILKSPPAKKLLEKAVDANDPKTAFNARSKAYKDLDIENATFKTKKEVVDLLRENPDMIRRPLLARGEKAILGFDEADYATFLR
ncbi:MAG TPA: Spx/MgsR family RNA polymerase-binding regulatory protein [Planctomycetota bacterium]